MIAFDTNLLIYARLGGHAYHAKALAFLASLDGSPDVVVAELVLVEYYVALRNPNIVDPALGPAAAADECECFRKHPHWRCVEGEPGVMDRVWPSVRGKGFARRRIFDIRLAHTLLRSGVTDFATANTKDFKGLGFRRVWNPLG